MNNERKTPTTPTPRTDAEGCRLIVTLPQGADVSDYADIFEESQKHARQLERELEEAREERDAAIIKYTGQVDASEQAHKQTIAKVESLRSALSTAERERDEARAACAQKDAALERNARTFHMYASHHEAKNTDEGRKRASVNAKLAMECESALTPNPGAVLLKRLRRAEERLETERDYIKKMDAVIDDMRVANSCINPLEDLKRAIAKLKGDRNAALSRCRELEDDLARMKANDNLQMNRAIKAEARVQKLEGAMKNAMATPWFRYCNGSKFISNALSSPPQPEDDSCEVCGSGKGAVADTVKRLYGCRCGGYIESFDAKQPSPEQKPQTVPVEIADGLAKALEDVLWKLDVLVPSGIMPPEANVLQAYRSAQAIGGRVE